LIAFTQDGLTRPHSEANPMADDQPTRHATPDGSAVTDPSSLKGLTAALGIEPADPYHDPLLDRDIGGVTVVRRIAEGGMGRVYEGLQDNPRRAVAVKVIRPGFVSSQTARRFILETEILGRLQHPFIAQIYSAGMCDVAGTKVPFFVMEFIPDALSITKYATTKALGTRDRLALFRKACEAVAHGHHNGVIHRDLKPSNILVDRSGTPKVIDFGVARCVDAKPEQTSALTDMGQLIGTLQYMSPEQISADPSKIDGRSDVYALGVILYELLTGQRPYEISQRQIFEAMRVVLETKPVAPSRLNSEVPRDVEMIAGKCLHKSHDRRFADAAALVTAIDRHLGGGRHRVVEAGWEPPCDDVFARLDRHPRRWPLLAAMAAAGIILTAALVHQFMRPTASDGRERRSREAPGHISLSGIGDSPSLEGTVPNGWLKQGVFADIRGAGEAKFPRLPFSAYVLDIDVEFRNALGRISFGMGEPGSGTDLPLGSLWPRDSQQDRVPCRLFRVQPWGVNWRDETHFNTNERLSLKLVVLDDEKALVRNGRPLLRATGNAADFCLSINTTPETDATIHRLSCRAPTPADAAEAGLAMPKRALECDISATERRIAARMAKAADRKATEGRDFALADSKLLLTWIEPGELTLGDPTAPYPQLGAGLERARISGGYWLGAYEVTQAQWDSLMQSNPSPITGSPYLPVNNVTWSDACRFCERLTTIERKAGRCPDGYEYRLPTETEWEWACRAGTDRPTTVPEADRPVRERYSSLVEIGATPANPWGLHEMLGNVPEWCLDTWQDYTGNVETPAVDRLPGSTTRQPPFVVRGGGVWFDESAATCFARTKRHDIPGGFRGFRVALARTAASFTLDRQLRDVFASLQSQRFKEARDVLEQSAAAARGDQQATERLERWQCLAQYAAEYPTYRDTALANATPGTEFDMGGRIIAIIDVTPQEVIFRDKGRNVRAPTNALPAGLQAAIIDHWLSSQGNAADHFVRGAAALARPKPDASVAREAWNAAVAGGEPHGGLLLAILEDPVIRGFISDDEATTPTRPDPGLPDATTRKLEQKLTLVFAKDTLERSIHALSKEIGVPMDILVADLQFEGITKNQSFGLAARDKTAREILLDILAKADPNGRLVYTVRNEAGTESIAITTRAAAAKRKEKLPPELERQPRPANN
jgi:formylglycine-generating enzyme required for sulfatase activity